MSLSSPSGRATAIALAVLLPAVFAIPAGASTRVVEPLRSERAVAKLTTIADGSVEFRVGHRGGVRVLRRSPARTSPIFIGHVAGDGVRLSRRITVPFAAIDRVTANGRRVTTAGLTEGMRVRVRWTLTRNSRVRSTLVSILERGAPARTIGKGHTKRPAPEPEATPTPVPTAEPTPAPTTEPPPAPSTGVLFEDTFDGAAGAPAGSTKWTYRGAACEGFMGQTCSKDENVFHDGAGNLVIRTKREPDGYMSHRYSTGMVSTFAYGWGWPATGVKADWPVPFRLQVRAKYPALSGGWGGSWAMNTDRDESETVYELDHNEVRTTLPTEYAAHQHAWLNRSDVRAWDCRNMTLGFDMTTDFHVYSADVYSDRVVYSRDGVVCGTSFGVPGRFGVILQMGIADAGSWGAAGSSGPTDAGPWDAKFDFVRVTSL